MKKVTIQILALMMSGAAMAQGVLNANIIDNRTVKTIEKKEKVMVVEKKAQEDKFLNNSFSNDQKYYRTQEGFWKDKKYSTTLVFYGCEMRINEYLIDINSIGYLNMDQYIYFHFDSRREKVRINSEAEKNEFLEEYRFRRSVCSFRRAL